METDEVPNYNRKHLLSVAPEVLIQKGVLVQVYNYKKDKKFPLKGNLELSAKKGVTVTFFKVGPDVHLEYQGKFYYPDILPEHLQRVFKKFSSEQVCCDRYPEDLEGLLKMSSSITVEGSKPEEKKKSVETEETNSKVQEEREKKKSKVPEDSGCCPLCQQTFPLSSLPDHAADCDGSQLRSRSSGAG